MTYQTQNVEEFFHIKATLIVGKPYKTKLSAAAEPTQKAYMETYSMEKGMISDIDYLQYLKICMKESKPEKEMRYIN